MNERIGPYLIQREVGRGGMGVVYLARDTRLDRDVAIKSLPEQVAQAPERLARFEREAKTLAGLSHPNVAGIYGVEEQDGSKYLVLEYVDGETLADVLDRGPIAAEDAVEFAIQIAAGVEAAHDAGIVHRDLKPANIKITSEGVIKVLDFGLARFEETTGASSTAMHENPTLTTPHAANSPTIEGAILGTAAYMSPEQARGRKVDKRTDIWSFGVVLYEMLLGSSPFVGETVSDSIGAILHKDLDLSKLPDSTPGRVRGVLERCLVRDKNLRYRDIGDLRLELLKPEAEVERAGTKPSLAGTVVLALVVVFTITSGTVAWLLKPSEEPPPLPVVVSDLALPDTKRLAHTFFPGIAISPDGRAVAFAGGTPEGFASTSDIYVRGNLMVRRLDQPDAVEINGIGGAVFQPAFSPDGRSIAYVLFEDDTIYRIPVTGGVASRLADDDPFVLGLHWADDGRIYYGSQSGIRSLSDDGGAIQTLTQPNSDTGESSHGYPWLLPDGLGLLYTSMPRSIESGGFSVWVLDAQSGTTTKLVDNASDAKFTNGQIVFARDGELLAMPFDAETLTPLGEPRAMGIELVHSLHSPNSRTRNGAAQYAVSAAGDLVYAPGSVWPGLSRDVYWVDRDGNETKVDVAARTYGSVNISPDGDRIVLTDFYAPTSAAIVADLDRGIARTALSGSSILWSVWGPGDDQITLTTGDEEGRNVIRWVDIGQRALPDPLPPFADEVDAIASEWTADRKYLVALLYGTDFDIDIGVWSEDEGWQRITDTPDVRELWPTVAPDGKWLAYVSNESGEREVYISPFLSGGPSIQVSSSGGSSPLWSADGTELFFRTGASSDDPDPWIMAASVRADGSNLDIGIAERLFEDVGYGRTVPIRSWAVAADGRFLMVKQSSEETIREAVEGFSPDHLRLIQNWSSRFDD